jgi:hypothetical protein
MVRELDNLLTPRQFPDRAELTRFVDEYMAALTVDDLQCLRSEFESARSNWNAILGATSSTEVESRLETFLTPSKASAGLIRHTVSVPDFPRGMTSAHGREAGEEFLSDLNIPIDLRHRVSMDARVKQSGFRDFSLRQKGYPLRKGADLEFRITSCTVPEPFSVKWKVKNTGEDAARVGQLRGEINEDNGRFVRPEKTRYWGTHYVQCYVIKDGICVAADHIDVPIGRL